VAAAKQAAEEKAARAEAVRKAAEEKALAEKVAAETAAAEAAAALKAQKEVGSLLEAAVPKQAPPVAAKPGPSEDVAAMLKEAAKAPAPAKPEAPAPDALDVDAYGEQVKRQVVARRASPTKAPKYVPTNPNGPAKPVEIELKNPFDALSVKVQEYLDTLEQPSEKGLALKQGKAPEKRERRTYTPSPQRPRPVKKPATEKEANVAVQQALDATNKALQALSKAASGAVAAGVPVVGVAVTEAYKNLPNVVPATVSGIENLFHVYEKAITFAYTVVPKDAQVLETQTVAGLLLAVTLGIPLTTLYQLRYGGYSGDFRPKRVEELLKTTNALLVDVRTESERAEGGVPDLRRSARDKIVFQPPEALDSSVKGQVDDPEEVERNRQAFTIANLEQVRSASRVIVMDKNGSQAIQLARLLKEMGVERPYTMDGGYASWVRSGLKFKPDEPETAVDVLKKEVEALAEDDDNVLGQFNSLLSTNEGRVLLAGRLTLGLSAAALIVQNYELLLALAAAAGITKVGADNLTKSLQDPSTSKQSELEKIVEQAGETTRRAIELNDTITRAVTGVGKQEPQEPEAPKFQLPFAKKPDAEESPLSRLVPKPSNKKSAPPTGPFSGRSSTPPKAGPFSGRSSTPPKEGPFSRRSSSPTRKGPFSGRSSTPPK